MHSCVHNWTLRTLDLKVDEVYCRFAMHCIVSKAPNGLRSEFPASILTILLALLRRAYHPKLFVNDSN
jgi:hypothetical protein